MKKLIIGNWKLNPQTLRNAIALAKAVDKEEIIICPPHAFLEEVSKVLKKASACAQDIFWEQKGSFTGGVSPTQLKAIGVKHTLVGHSSRREGGETDTEINKKIKAALSESLTAILCVGESSSVHARGEAVTKKFIEGQTKKAVSRIKPSKKLIVAYEPIWAIGTNKPDTPADSAIIASHIKSVLNKMGWRGIKVLYGGSVDSKNAKGFLAIKVIDGLLVGMASIKEKEFNKIIKVNG